MSRWNRRSILVGMLASSLAPSILRAQLPAASPPLWLARGPVGSAILFGQMPVRADTLWQTPKVSAAFAASHTLWLENPVFSPEELKARTEELATSHRISTADFLSRADLKRLHAQLARIGQPSDAWDRLPADDLYQQLAATVDAMSGADFTRLPERIFRSSAISAGKTINTEWKDLSEVVHFLPPAPDPLRLDLIRLAVDDFDVAWQMDERLQAWTSGDAFYFDRSGAIMARRYPALTAKMNGVRNRRVAERLAAAMEVPGQHLVCVGIRHVTGPASIQSFLRARGVRVDRI